MEPPEEENIKENSLIGEYGVEGLKRKREEEEIEKIKEDGLKKQKINELSKAMVNLRQKLGTTKMSEMDTSLTLDSFLPKPEAKMDFSLTEGQIKKCHDHGPLGRAKSSYKISDLLILGCTNDTVLIRRLQLEALKAKYPEHVGRNIIHIHYTYVH